MQAELPVAADSRYHRGVAANGKQRAASCRTGPQDGGAVRQAFSKVVSRRRSSERKARASRQEAASSTLGRPDTRPERRAAFSQDDPVEDLLVDDGAAVEELELAVAFQSRRSGA